MEFWEVTKARLAATEAALRLKTLELEEQQAAHSVAIKVYRDRLRSLMAAHSTREEEIKVAGEAALQQRTSELAAQAGAREDGHRSSLHQARLEVQNAREAQNRCMLECEARVDAHRATFERIAASVHERYEGHLAEQVHAAEERCQAQVHAVAKQRDDAVAKLEAQQEAAMKEAREHFAATCSAQLDLVAALKGDVQQAREAAEKAHRRIATNRAPINAN